MSNLLDNINKGIAELHPYEPGRSIDEVVAEYKPDKVLLTSGFNGLFLINCQSSWLIPKRNKLGSNEGEDCIATISPV